jgi:hypothetical protein
MVGPPQISDVFEAFDALDAVDGLDGFDGFRGSLKCDRSLASVRLESGDWIRVSLPLDSPLLPPLEALAANARLPGNVRFALSGGAQCLVGDSRLDGMGHLPESLGEIRSALCRRGRVPDPEASAPTPDTALDTAKALELKVQKTLEALPFGEDGVVRLETGWELRPRLGGETLPVRATIDGAGLRLRRAFAWDPPEAPMRGRDTRAAAVAREALRINHEIRLSRISLDEGGGGGLEGLGALLVETRLHSGLLDAEWIATAARALCHAYRHAQVPLGALQADLRVANAYLAIASVNPHESHERYVEGLR